MFLVGLTGGIASGKSTVAKWFRHLGIPVIDADEISKQVVAVGTESAAKIRIAFGDQVFRDDGNIDRETLGKIVFKSSQKRKLLNSIVHPIVQKEMMCQVLVYFLQGYNYVILDIPLLYENKKLLKFLAYTVVVTCTREQQLSRLMARNHFDKDTAESRIEAQLPLNDKAQYATYIIDNRRGQSDTKGQVQWLHQELNSKYRHWFTRLFALSVIFALLTALGKVISIFVL